MNVSSLAQGGTARPVNSHWAQQATSSSSSSCTTDMLKLLLTSPSRQEIVQYLVLEVFADWQAWGACIVLNEDFGLLKTKAQYGLGPGYKSPLDGQRSSAALHSGMTLAKDSDDGALQNPLGQSIAGVLRTPNRFLGFVQVFIESDHNLEIAQARMQEICLPLSVAEMHHNHLAERLAGTRRGDNAEPKPRNSLNHGRAIEVDAEPHENTDNHNGDHNGVAPDAASLSERQMQVLQLMATGKTNNDIARIIGYSESTVRQETMAIYRILGVHDRTKAADTAYRLGLIDLVTDRSLAEII